MINPMLPCIVSWWAGGVTEDGVVHLSGYRTMVSARLSLISGASCVTVRQTDTASV